MSQLNKAVNQNTRNVDLNGQWFGYYMYGPEYGPGVEGEKILFSIIIEQQEDRSFTGKCIEINGLGASSEIARLQGYIDDTFISFVKHYRKHPTLDIEGNPIELENVSSTRLMYSGTIDPETDIITGKWEIWLDHPDAPEGDPAEVTTGIWEISRDPARYGI